MRSSDRQPLSVGEIVAGKYRIERPLGQGGMASVFAATHLDLGGLVALKVLLVDEHDPRRDEARTRFSREARAMFALKCEHVARVFDVGTLPSGAPYLVMEHLDGKDFEALAASGPFPIGRAVGYILEACRGVREAHAIGIVHRDLKPSNLFLARGAGGREIVKVIDFGISKSVAPAPDDVAVTSTRSMVGTPRYMAPERFLAASDASPSADIWGLGAVLYRLLTGKPPYDAPTAFSLHAKILTELPIAPEVLRPEIPPALSAIVMRCLKREPAERFASVAELASALESTKDNADPTLESGDRVDPTPSGVDAPRSPPLPRRGFGLAIGVFAALAGAFAFVRYGAAPSPRANPPPSARPPAAPAALHVKNPRRMTFGDGCEELPAFTRDGQSIVYDATLGASSSILLMDAQSGASRAITTVTGWDYAARLSPDGTRVAFLRSAEGRTAVYVADLRGGSPARHFADGNSRPSWSLDGRSLWAGDRAHVVRYDAETGAVQETLAAPVGYQATRAIELAGGDVAVLFPFFDGTAGGGVGVFDARRAFTWKLKADVGVEFAATPDGSSLLVPRKLVSGTYELVGVSLGEPPPPGGPMLLGAGEVAPNQGLDVSPDGKRIAWSTCGAQDELAAVDAQGALAPIRVGGDRNEQDVAWIPGTDRLVVVSARGGLLRPWIVDESARVAPALVALEGPDVTAVAVSPDGKWLAVEARPEGLRVASLADPAGVRTLTSGQSDAWPSFRHNGDLLFTHTNDDGSLDVRAVPLAGGDARVLLPAPARRAVASPVDDRVVFLAGADAQKLVPMVQGARSGKPSPLSPSLVPARYGALQFSPDGKKIAIVRAGRDLYEIDAATGAVLRTVRVDDQITRITYTRDRLVVVRQVWRGDVWMADLEP